MAENKPHPASSVFRVFRTPAGTWSWTLVRSPGERPLARGREFDTREDAVANTVILRESVIDAGWATDSEAADNAPEPTPVRWAEILDVPTCSAPGCYREATARVEGGLIVRGSVVRSKAGLCEEHALQRLDWARFNEEMTRLTQDIVAGDLPRRRGLIRRNRR